MKNAIPYYLKRLDQWSLTPLLLLLASFGLVYSAAAVAVVTVTATNGLSCAGARATTSCNSNDFTSTVTIGSQVGTCVSGGYYTLSGQVSIQSNSADRYDIGFFTGEVGNNPTAATTVAQGATCSVTTFPISPTPWFQSSLANTCGDFRGSGSDTPTIQNMRVYCQGNSLGELAVPYALVWSSNDNQGGCTGPGDVKVGTSPKCISGTAYVSGVTVLPALNKTDNVSGTVKAGTTTGLAYTVKFSNLSATSTVATFTDNPLPTNFTLSSIACTTSSGVAACPSGCTTGTCSVAVDSAITTGAGISVTVPAAINTTTPGTVTFTLNGSYTAPSSATSFTNTAAASVSNGSTSASDTIYVMVPPTVAMSFTQPTIGVNGTSLLTITLTNPNASAMTGAAFTDTYPTTPGTGLKNSGTVVSNTCTSGGTAGTATAANGGGSLTYANATIAANGSCTVTVNVTATATGTYTNSTGPITTANAGAGTAASATLSVVGSVNSFNAFETSTAPNTVITGPIYTKLAGTGFGLDVVAIAGASKATSFSGNVKVELLANTGTPGSGYGADNCPTSSSVIYTIASAPIASGRSTVNFIAANFSPVANAYRDVRVRISYPTTSSTISICSTDSFAIRPAAFTITSSSATGGTAATNTGTSGSPVIKTGANFNLTATAVTGYGLTPNLDASQVVGSSTAGTLSGSFGAANSATGVATGNAFTYSEVGNFGLNANAVYDTSFTSVDPSSDCTADFSNTLVGFKYGCKIGSNAVAQTTGSSGFGRFIPDHFDTAVVLSAGVPMPCPTGLTCPTLYNGFVYSGQPFSVKVTAKNLAGGTTQNYDGTLGYAKRIDPADGAGKGLAAWDALGSTTTQNPSGLLTNNSITAATFSAGVATTSTPVYTLATVTTAPTDIYIRAVDTDDVTSLRAASVEGGVKVVSGRIKVSNAYGSELLPLPMTATVQFYNNTGTWVTSTTDNITTFSTATNIVASIVKGPLAGVSVVSPGVVTVAGGVRSFKLNKPLLTGSADITFNAPTYLSGAAGRATFGVYKGSNNFIYQRENY